MNRKLKRIFVVLVICSLTFFSFVGKDTPTEGLTIGDKAPSFAIRDGEQPVDLKELRGKYVLLSFWASYDAPSRVQNAILSHAVAAADKVEMVSISFDDYKSVFEGTIKKTAFPRLRVMWNGQAVLRNCFKLTVWEKALETSCWMRTG